MGLMGLSHRETKKKNYSHKVQVSSIFSESEDLAMTHLSLSSVASFIWVWWIHRVTPATFTDVELVRTAGHGTFYFGSRFQIWILFTRIRSPAWNL